MFTLKERQKSLTNDTILFIKILLCNFITPALKTLVWDILNPDRLI